jgi:hypothetical protein
MYRYHDSRKVGTDTVHPSGWQLFILQIWMPEHTWKEVENINMLDKENNAITSVEYKQQIKGTVARDFRPPVFLVNRPHMDSRFTL